ncbi:hypothetical protein [Wolbachia endosymbiont (group E) of Neria commutata]|uniref:hypothetical protein n=1 Tax=Wolbachia endosymbiont (group E) of Neria commutata TaxID=3066149 RepID=UPI003133143F
MVDKGKEEDEFMKQYMDTCKEQIEKLAKDPELLNQTLKPFMQMSQQIMAGAILDGAIPNMIPDNSMDVNKMIAQKKAMIDYIKAKYKGLVKQYNRSDDVIEDLNKYSKQLRSMVKKLIEKIEESDQ